MPQRSSEEAEFSQETEKIFSNKLLNHALLDSLPYPAMLIRKDRRIVSANKAAKDMGVAVASFCWDSFGKRASITPTDREYYEKTNSIPPSGIKCTFCKAHEALAAQKPVNEKIPAGDITYDTYWIPLSDDVYLHYAIVLP